MGVNLRDLLIFVTPSDELTIGYSGLLTLSTLLLHKLTELQRTEQLQKSLHKAKGATEKEQACDGRDFAQTEDLRAKTGDLESDLKIWSDWRGNTCALEIHTNNSSGLTMLEKNTALVFRSILFDNIYTKFADNLANIITIFL